MRRTANIEHLEKNKYYDATFKCDCGGGHTTWNATVRVDGLDLNTPGTAELVIVDSDEGAVQAGFKFTIYEFNSRWCYGPLHDPITFTTVSVPDEPVDDESSQVAASRVHALYGSRQDHNPVLGFEALLEKYSAEYVPNNEKTAGLLPKEPCPKCGGQLVPVVHPFQGVECSNKDIGGCDYEQHDDEAEGNNLKPPPSRRNISDAFHVGYTLEDDNAGNVGDSDYGSELPDPRYSTDGAGNSVGSDGVAPGISPAQQSAITQDDGNMNGNNDGVYPKGAPRGGSRRVIRREAKPQAGPNRGKPRTKAPVVWDQNRPNSGSTPPKPPSTDWERVKQPSTDIVPYKAPGLPQVTNPPANPQQPQQQTPFPSAPPPAPATPPGKKPPARKPSKPPFHDVSEAIQSHEGLVRSAPGTYVPPRSSSKRIIRRSAGPKRIVPKNPAQSSEPNPAVTEEHSLIPEQPTKGKNWKEKSLLPGHERGQRKDPNNKIPRKRKSSVEGANWFPDAHGNVFEERDDKNKLNVDEATKPEITGNDPVDTRSAGLNNVYKDQPGWSEDSYEHYVGAPRDSEEEDRWDHEDDHHTAATSEAQVCDNCGTVVDGDDDDGSTFDNGGDTSSCPACGHPLETKFDLGVDDDKDEGMQEAEQRTSEPEDPISLPSMASHTAMSMSEFFDDDGGSNDDDEYHRFMMANLQSLVATGQPSVPMTTMGPEWSEDVEPTNDDGSYGRPRVTSSVSDADLFL